MDDRKLKYSRQHWNACRRDIGWLFTFDTWWDVWEKSGKWDQRGTGTDKYMMCRIDDSGPYAPDNVTIKTSSENAQESWDIRKTGKRDPFRLTDRKTAWDHEYTCNWLEIANKVLHPIDGYPKM